MIQHKHRTHRIGLEQPGASARGITTDPSGERQDDCVVALIDAANPVPAVRGLRRSALGLGGMDVSATLARAFEKVALPWLRSVTGWTKRTFEIILILGGDRIEIF
jgi:hypothetical protein